ncbi:hypothetical protein M441DRAFT_154693, partial [Trichoderma asperellum CBS 433.97]
LGIYLNFRLLFKKYIKVIIEKALKAANFLKSFNKIIKGSLLNIVAMAAKVYIISVALYRLDV